MAQGDRIRNFERVNGSEFDDIITGDAANNFLRGFGGNDTINGGLGDDRIEGGEGADDLDGGDGLEDTLSYQGSSAGVTIDLKLNTASGGDAQGDTFQNFERLLGSNFDDDLNGDHGDNEIMGLGGSDEIRARGGNDLVEGGDGDDNIFGGADDDILLGGVGRDILRGDSGNDTLDAGEHGGNSYQLLDGGAGDDTYLVSSDNGYIWVRGEAAGGGTDSIVFTDLNIGDFTDVRVRDAATNRVAFDHANGSVHIFDLQQFESFEFADGTVLDTISVLGTAATPGASLVDTAGADWLIGDNLATTLNIGEGDDILTGKGGADIFAFTQAAYGQEHHHRLPGRRGRLELYGHRPWVLGLHRDARGCRRTPYSDD